MVENANCAFCKLRPSSERVIHESRHHYVIASRFAMGIPGYVLLVSKDHISCFGAPESTLEELDDFEDVRHELLETLSGAYGNKEVVFFEHGIAGQTVNHAHMHFLPVGADCFAKIQDAMKDWNEGFSDLKRTDAGFELRMVCQQAVSAGGGYLVVGCGHDARVISCNDPKSVEKGLLRKVLARSRGLDESLADWRNNAAPDASDDALVGETTKTLREHWTRAKA